MTREHSPAPWRAHGNDVTDADGRLVATMAPRNADANQALTVAAPKLLDTVRHLAQRMTGDPEVWWHCGELTATFEHVCECLAAVNGEQIETVRERIKAAARTTRDRYGKTEHEELEDAQDSIDDMEMAAAGTKPPKPLSALAADPDASVRLQVAGNPSTSANVLAALVADHDEYVRWLAKQTIAQLEG